MTYKTKAGMTYKTKSGMTYKKGVPKDAQNCFD